MSRENRQVGEADQIDAWGRALYEANTFYAERSDWLEMASPDGGIKDLHLDMARAAKVVWDTCDDPPAPASDLEQVSRELDEAVRLLRAIDDGYARPDVGHEDFRVQVKLWTDAFLNNLDNRNE